MQQISGSFRDPSGYVLVDQGKIVRTINECYAKEWDHVISSGLMKSAVDAGQVIPFEECPPVLDAWKSLKVEKIPFIAYPYEWCFGQVKDAALLTLALQKKALDHDCVLKDASAFNIQFRGVSPVFIDLLSFETWQEGSPWQAYRQFCSHFLAPLALLAYCGTQCGRLSQLWIDGIPLDIATTFLPAKARLKSGLLMHLYLHASMQEKHADGRESAEKVKKIHMSKKEVLSIADSLERTVESLSLPKGESEWSGYYQDTNYSDDGIHRKAQIVARFASEHKGNVALDLGANTGMFSKEMSPYFQTVIAADYDPLAVERHYQALRGTNTNIMPLVLDLANPSPALGWNNTERQSFSQRAQADFVAALALCHHLRFTFGIPFTSMVDCFADMTSPNGAILVEFVPKEDSQVQRLLAARDDVFADYTLENFKKAFASRGFSEECCETLPQSLRTLHLFRKK